MRRLILLYLLLSQLAGCIGAAVVLPQTREDPPVTDSLHSPGPVAGHWSREDVRRHHVGEMPEITHEGAQEVWRYRGEDDWCGALVLVVPLVLPVCSDMETYRFEGDRVSAHTSREIRLHGVVCSLSPLCPEGADCSACVAQ